MLKKVESNTCDLNIFENKNNINYLINGLEGKYRLFIFSPFYTSKIWNFIIKNLFYFNSIRINKDLVALTISSKIIESYNKIIFYNINMKQAIKTIEEYSPSINTQHLELLPGKDINNEILLCGCKKIEDNKNGILLLNIKFGYNINIKYYFQETEEIEIYCFSPIILYSDTIKEFRDILIKIRMKKLIRVKLKMIIYIKVKNIF